LPSKHEVLHSIPSTAKASPDKEFIRPHLQNNQSKMG
jgi:hypothetical protein